MFGEDIDLSLRIQKAGFHTVLIRDAFVYHKRRVSFRSFYRQVSVFGRARVDLYLLHPESLKIVHLTCGICTWIVDIDLIVIFLYMGVTPVDCIFFGSVF